MKVTEDGEWSLYENVNALPLVYSYDTVFSEEAWQDLHGFDKQQVMLQAAATEGYQGELEETTAIENDLAVLEYSIENIENGKIENNILQLEAGGKITLSSNLKADGENYLLFEDVQFDNNITITIPGDMSKSLVLTSAYHNGNIGVNLGNVAEDAKKQIVLTFQNTEMFELNQMRLLWYDFSEYDKYISELREESLKELAVSTNKVEYIVDLDRRKMICVAVPFSSGWTAYIDGNETDIYRVNDMFMGIEVSEGKHNIMLKYVTSGIEIGIIISLTFVVIVVIYVCIMRKGKKLVTVQ